MHLICSHDHGWAWLAGLQVCRSPKISVYRSAGLQVCRSPIICRSPGLQVYRSTGRQVYRSAGLQVCRSSDRHVCSWVYRSAGLQVCRLMAHGNRRLTAHGTPFLCHWQSAPLSFALLSSVILHSPPLSLAVRSSVIGSPLLCHLHSLPLSFALPSFVIGSPLLCHLHSSPLSSPLLLVIATPLLCHWHSSSWSLALLLLVIATPLLCHWHSSPVSLGRFRNGCASNDMRKCACGQPEMRTPQCQWEDLSQPTHQRNHKVAQPQGCATTQPKG